jgi:superfamily II DNA/RNA helicase
LAAPSARRTPLASDPDFDRRPFELNTEEQTAADSSAEPITAESAPASPTAIDSPTATDSLADEASAPTATEETPSDETSVEETPAPQTFADLGVLPTIVESLADVGIVHPFPIQSMAIPIALTGTDMIGQARTGTGKTLAFGVTLLQRIVVPGERDFELLANPGAPQALVVTPTRELASQVSKDLQVAATHRAARVLTVYGGVGYEPQLEALANGVEVVVGTPGRLLDLADRRSLDLSHVKVLVLDEADEMLDLGFLPDVERIISKVHELRQTMLFSATMPSAIVAMARHHLRHPVNIRAESAHDTTTVPTTAQFVYRAHDLDKPEVIARILQAENRNRVMIFCRTKRTAQRVADDLAERGFAAAAIHGDLSQVLRERALKKFRGDSINVLVATDVAARGIDVEGVTHVINYECPDDDKTYVHRIGRTGRAGASGIAVTFVDWADGTRWKVINNTLGLPFEEPQETYSTSDHLYHDLGIDRSARGRIAPPKEQTEAEHAPRKSRERAPRKRSRQRLRNGVPVGAGDAPASNSEPTGHGAGADQAATSDHAADAVPAEDGISGRESAPKRRRRRRRSSESPAGAASAD